MNMYINIIEIVYKLHGVCTYVVLYLSCYYTIGSPKGVQGFTISPQIPNPIFVKKGEEVTLFCNYTLAGENGNDMSAVLYVNGTNEINRVFTFAKVSGSIIRQNFSEHFALRSDVFFHDVRSPTTYVAVEIQHAQFSDTGNYTWKLNFNFGLDQLGGIIETIVGESPERANFSATLINNTTYELQCEVTGGIPVPDIQIRNTSQILLRSPSSSTASLTNITVTSEDQYYCTGTNGLGSVNSNYVILPEPETTTSVPPSTSTVGGSDNSPGPAPSFTTPGEKGGSPGPVSDTNKPGGQQGISQELMIALIVIAVVVVIAVIAIVIVLHKKSANKRQAKPDKTPAAEEHTENQYSDMQMDETKHQQEQEEKQQRNVEGLQYADLDLRPTGKTKPAGGRNNIVIDEDSKTEYAEVRKA